MNSFYTPHSALVYMYFWDKFCHILLPSMEVRSIFNSTIYVWVSIFLPPYQTNDIPNFMICAQLMGERIISQCKLSLYFSGQTEYYIIDLSHLDFFLIKLLANTLLIFF